MEFIDFRSDTVTVPTEEMLEAMRYAKVGDDVYSDDPTVIELEEKSAALLKKEAAIFVPTGTFGNQLALLTHTGRGDEVILPEDSHIVLYEVGASAVIAGVQLRLLHKGLNGFIDLKELSYASREDDIHYPKTALICMENAHTNGTVVSIDNIKEVSKFAKSKNISTHLDGARIFNAAVALNISPFEIAEHFDSVMFCFSKGLCAPIGSILAGNEDFIKKAQKNRKLMGGGMRQVGYIAAPCIVALDKMIDRLKDDHENAKYLANKLKEIPAFEVVENRLDINMVFFKIKDDEKIINKFNDNRFVNYLFKNNIKINHLHHGEYRFVTHYYITKEKINFTTNVIKKFIEEEIMLLKNP